MVTTETFKHLREMVKNEMILILQCHGVPGSGKSEIIRKLAKEFPFENNSNEADHNILIKWHIQCKDRGHDLQEKLKELAKKLLKNSFIANQDECQIIVDDLEENDTKLLVDALANTDVPVLIIVEDLPNKLIATLKDLCDNLIERAEKQKPILKKKIHLYISSRRKITLLDRESNVPFYKLEKIKGFNQKEAVDYLNRGPAESDNSSDILPVFKFFSGSPLGLNVARAHCKRARIDYKQYLKLVKDVDYNIISKEKKAIEEEYGDSAQHVFQAIVVPFMPRDKDDKTEVLRRKILSCLSYFHYDRIPTYVLEQCCHLIRTGKVKNFFLRNKEEVGELISDLLDHDMCTETDKQEITFHEVVLNAFRLSHFGIVEDNSETLKKSVEIMCSLVSKDLREKEHSEKMFQLRMHLQTLLDHVENCNQIFDNKIDEVLFRALTSYLHETTAAIMLGESSSLYWNECNQHFENSLKVMFSKEVCKYSELPKSEEKVEDVAREILKMSISKGSDLPRSFAAKYASKLNLCLQERQDLFKHLKSRSTNSQCFADLEKQLSEKKTTENIIKMLQKCGLFLDDKSYRLVFYVERFASILYSWSRLVIYADSEDVKKMSERCLWMSSLSHQICVECRTSFGVALLTEHLSITGGRIPIMVKLKKSPMMLEEALRICKEHLNNNENADVSENGLFMKVQDTRISLLRYIVRINARVLNGASTEFVKLADENCEELFKLSTTSQAKSMRICIMCIIYCAKYFAAKGDFGNALKCFDKFFELESSCDPRFHIRCWAVYNYARAVIKFENYSSELTERALYKCEKVLSERDEIKKALKDHLSTCKKILGQKLQAIKKNEEKAGIGRRGSNC